MPAFKFLVVFAERTKERAFLVLADPGRLDVIEQRRRSLEKNFPRSFITLLSDAQVPIRIGSLDVAHVGAGDRRHPAGGPEEHEQQSMVAFPDQRRPVRSVQKL